MSTASPPYARPQSYVDAGLDPRRWLLAGLAALFVLIGVSVVIAVAVPVLRGGSPTWSTDSAPWNWIVGLIGLLLAIWIVVWVVRIFTWGVWGAPYSPGYWRHYYRHRYYRGGPYSADPAVDIARERFARGEISQEQLDQILRELSKGSGPLPPS
jgi:uncharacterized membrane protein